MSIVADVTRAYDAENRMTSETQANSYVAGSYAYDADGRRVKRTVGAQPSAVETWQVYGIGGELLGEYAANASPASPQKEYGYRNGQLLITAEPPSTTVPRTNFALAANGATASASSTYSPSSGTGYNSVPAVAINGDRTGKVGSATAFWNDGTQNSGPDWLQVDFSGTKSIDEIDLFTVQDNYTSPGTPTETMTFSAYGLTAYDLQYWDGSAWVTVTGGSVTSNNKVWKKLTFTAVSTTKVRVLANATVDGWSRVAEVEAWGNDAPTNVALSSNGATATASSTYSPSSGSGYSAVAANTINGDRTGRVSSATSWWNDGTQNSGPDWLQVDFSGSKTIGEIDVFTAQDNYTSPSAPTETMTFSAYGLTGYDVQYWDGSAWATVSGGSLTGNNKVWRKLTFAAITTIKIRVLANATSDGWSRITEVEAWTPSTSANINWLVTDQLGTPRMIFDQSGSLATTKRHDYLPFGEEIFADTGGRTTAMGYSPLGNSAADGVRQKFTQKERDLETGLDYFGARNYASIQGRFTSPDSYGGRRVNPQTLNLYSYVTNNPLKYVDPTGHAQENSDCDQACQESRKEAERLRKEAEAEGVDTLTTEGKGTKYIPTSSQMITDWWGVLGGRFSIDSYRRNYQELLKARSRQGDEQGRAASKWLQEGLESNDLQFALTMTGAGSLLEAEDETYVTVGRWMSQLELDKMLETALVQESRLGGITSVTFPANPNAYLNAKPGSVYVQFDVLKSVLRGSGGSTAKIYGPNSMFGPLLNISRMPQAKNIVPIMSKIPRK